MTTATAASNVERLAIQGENPQPVMVIGSVAFDNIATPFGKGDRILGGSASYASLAASYFTETRMLGVVGKDFDEDYIRRLQSRGIDLSGLQRDDSGPTFFWSGKYHENFASRETLQIELGVFADFQPKLPDGFEKTPYVMLGNIHPALLLHVRDQLADDVFTITDTIDLWIETEREKLLQLIKRVDLFVINDEECQQITGERNMVLGGRKLVEIGPKMAIVKKGEHGAYLFHPEGMFALPAFPVTELRDPTGAGDSFAGALLGFLAAKNDTSFATIREAMLYATATASMTVEAFSCDRLESAGAPAVQQRVDELRKMITV